MNKLTTWFMDLSNRVKDSFYILMTIIGMISTFCTIMGISLSDWNGSSVWTRLEISITILIFSYGLIYLLLGQITESSVHLSIKGTKINILKGDIFEIDGWKVIGCDNHFDTRVDNNIISENSLHGKFILKQGNKSNIINLIETEAIKLNLSKNQNRLYDFPLGTIIKYYSEQEKQIYLLLAMLELDEEHRAYTNISDFKNMLIKMWTEIDRVYARHIIVIPLLGTGITRFKNDYIMDAETSLKYLLFTLSISGIHLKSEVKIVIHNDVKDLDLYECRTMFKMLNSV